MQRWRQLMGSSALEGEGTTRSFVTSAGGAGGIDGNVRNFLIWDENKVQKRTTKILRLFSLSKTERHLIEVSHKCRDKIRENKGLCKGESPGGTKGLNQRLSAGCGAHIALSPGVALSHLHLNAPPTLLVIPTCCL